MKGWVVDVNVLIVANRPGEYSQECRSGCIATIEELKETLMSKEAKFLLDIHGEIFEQYRGHLQLYGQGLGDAFFRWIYYENALLIERVWIHHDPDRGYQEFPDDPELEKFDRDDRVYVAVACAYNMASDPNSSEIVNAVDSDWEIFQEPLRRNGVKVRNLPGCPRKEVGS